MSNLVVLITGAPTGIGRATTFAFAKEGARVVVSGRRDDTGEALAAELRAIGGAGTVIDVRPQLSRGVAAGAVGRVGPPYRGLRH